MVTINPMKPLRFLRTCTTLACDNFRSSWRSAGYLVVTLAVATAVWLVLAALAAPFVGDDARPGSGVTISNGSQSDAPLPLRYARRIQAVPGARDVAWFTLVIVTCGSHSQVTINAWGGPGAVSRVSSSDRRVSAAAMQRWDADPLGVLVSSRTASDCGWRVGQGAEPPVAFGNKSVPLHISGVFDGPSDTAVAHFDYVNRIAPMFGADTVLKYHASGGSAPGDRLLAARIEAEFAHDFPTASATTNAMAQNAWARYGKLQQLLGFVMVAILSCAASVMVSVLAHAAVQRKSRFALLEVLGFGPTTLFGAFTLELLATALVGVVLGIGLAKLADHQLASTTAGMLAGSTQIPPWAWWGLPAWLIVLTAVALVWPAAVIARVRPVDYRTA